MRALASSMLESSKEKAALWAAESLVVGFSCEVEAQPRDFAVALELTPKGMRSSLGLTSIVLCSPVLLMVKLASMYTKESLKRGNKSVLLLFCDVGS